MRKCKQLFIVGLLLPALLMSCLKLNEDDETIVLFGEEGYVKGFDSVFGMPMDSVFGMPMDSVFLTAYDGIMTPDVRGEFKFNPVDVVSSRKFDPTHGWQDVAFEAPQFPIYFRFGGDFHQWDDYFHGQNHMVTHCDIRIPGLELNAELFHSDYAYVKGNGRRFLAYLDREQEVQTPVGATQVRFLLSQGIAIFGERLVDSIPGNIKNCYVALYNKEVSVLNPQEVAPEIVEAIESRKGLLTVYQDADAVTELNRTGTPYVNWEE